VKETGRGGWTTATKHLDEAPANWSEEEIKNLLDAAEDAVTESLSDLQMRGRLIRKKRSIGLVPDQGAEISREALDETVLRCQTQLSMMNDGTGPNIPFCAFNGGRDVWVDAGNKRVGVQLLGSYLGFEGHEILHIGDQFLNTGNDFAARAVCPCIWITNPTETTYILKTILRLAGIEYDLDNEKEASAILSGKKLSTRSSNVNFEEMERRSRVVQEMDVFTGEMKKG
jgi:IMP and pyridine-specific 5'-nucleotidase